MMHVPDPRWDAALALIRASGYHALTVGPADPAGVGMDMLGQARSVTLDDWIAQELWLTPDADPKTVAALLIGRLSWVVTDILCGFHLCGLVPVAIRRDALTFTLRRGRWEYEGESGNMLHYDPHIDPAGIRFGGSEDGIAGLRKLVESLHDPIVTELHWRSKLGKAALWRLVADSLASSFLEHGKRTDQAYAAMGLATAILSDTLSPLHNKQTGFVQITLPDDAEGQTCDWFRTRGGCCRYYTLPGEDYCSTCVLRPTESRDALLRDHLKNRATA